MHRKFFFPALPGHFADGDGYFDAFGGKFIPERRVRAGQDRPQPAHPITAQIDQHLTGVCLGRVSRGRPAPRGAQQGSLQQILGVTPVASQCVGGSQQDS
jgi:hypothetical protein